MRLSPQTLSAAGDSPWMIPGSLLDTPAVALALTFTSNANLTAAVQYTYDDPAQTPKAVTLTRVTTVLTINLPNHGLNQNDAIELSNANGTVGNGTWSGSYDIASITDQNNVTVAVANSGPTSDSAQARTYKLFLHPTLQAITGTPPARIDGFFNYPNAAFRLHVTAYTAGSATLSAQQGRGQ